MEASEEVLIIAIIQVPKGSSNQAYEEAKIGQRVALVMVEKEIIMRVHLCIFTIYIDYFISFKVVLIVMKTMIKEVLVKMGKI